MPRGKITISISYQEILLGLERMCGLKNVSFGGGPAGFVEATVSAAAAAIPILLSKVCPDQGGESCDQHVDMGKISETEDGNGNKMLQIDVMPTKEEGKALFLECVIKLQTALSEVR
jgi:hypothetical protein